MNHQNTQPNKPKLNGSGILASYTLENVKAMVEEAFKTKLLRESGAIDDKPRNITTLLRYISEDHQPFQRIVLAELINLYNSRPENNKFTIKLKMIGNNVGFVETMLPYLMENDMRILKLIKYYIVKVAPTEKNTSFVKDNDGENERLMFFFIERMLQDVALYMPFTEVLKVDYTSDEVIPGNEDPFVMDYVQHLRNMYQWDGVKLVPRNRNYPELQELAIGESNIESLFELNFDTSSVGIYGKKVLMTPNGVLQYNYGFGKMLNFSKLKFLHFLLKSLKLAFPEAYFLDTIKLKEEITEDNLFKNAFINYLRERYRYEDEKLIPTVPSHLEKPISVENIDSVINIRNFPSSLHRKIIKQANTFRIQLNVANTRTLTKPQLISFLKDTLILAFPEAEFLKNIES